MAYNVTTDKTWARIVDDLEESFRKWGGVAPGWRVESILAPRSSTKQNQTTQERTVTLRWQRRSKAYEITMARQWRAVDNLLVIWLIVEALRLNEARGFAEQIAAVYKQEFPALPGPGQTGAAANPTAHHYALLCVLPSAPLEVCEAAYRALAKAAHPDQGGASSRMYALNKAIETIRKEKAT